MSNNNTSKPDPKKYDVRVWYSNGTILKHSYRWNKQQISDLIKWYLDGPYNGFEISVVRVQRIPYA